ncbi:MAG: ABC transporter permease [Oscillospiraceae bacterium]|nr:ABC transporter permease [Oscillospiraceae bacterium]
MRIIKAIFTKQAKDVMKSPMALVMFFTFPAVALLMTIFVAGSNDDIPQNMFVTMMAAIFAGMGLITSVSDAIAEDIERKCLRFLVIAGVKPHQYLIGTGCFYLLAGTVTSVVFALIGDFTFIETMKFLAIMVSGVAASILLGATIGIYSKNRQSATALAMPASVLVGFTPMLAAFNETIEKFAGILYTQQINVIVNDFSVSIWKPLLVILANIVVLLVLFIVAYTKKGLKG